MDAELKNCVRNIVTRLRHPRCLPTASKARGPACDAEYSDDDDDIDDAQKLGSRLRGRDRISRRAEAGGDWLNLECGCLRKKNRDARPSPASHLSAPSVRAIFVSLIVYFRLKKNTRREIVRARAFKGRTV